MNGFGNQVAVRVEAIPLTAVSSRDADTMKLYVQALAYRYQSELLLLHVVELGSTFGDPDVSLPVKIYRVFEEQCPQNLTGNREGTPTAKRLGKAGPDPNLLVIGTRGPGDLSRMVLGSTAQEFLRQADMPILTIGPDVPIPEQPIDFESIVYATDYSPEAAKACASAFSLAQVYVCHVLPDPEDDCDLGEDDLNDRFLDAVEDLVPGVSPECTDPDCVLDYKYAADGILLIAQRVKATLIVLGTRRARRRFNDSTTGLAFRVISGSSCPVLNIQG
jgi:nucleotide-binding universal stress UspA family protein